MFRFIKKIFIGLLTNIGNGSNHSKCVSLNNQQCMTQPTLIIIEMYVVKDYVIIHLQLV